MNAEAAVKEAFDVLRTAMKAAVPRALKHLLPPARYRRPAFLRSPGAEQLVALWALTAGQDPKSVLGIVGGLKLFGPKESERERKSWSELVTDGEGLHAVAAPKWDISKSLDPEAVRDVYYAMGWIPILGHPMEANYLAVDLVPLAGGNAGQIILCGRDYDKCVVTPDLATLLHALAHDCRKTGWSLEREGSGKNADVYVERGSEYPLLTDCQERVFPPRSRSRARKNFR